MTDKEANESMNLPTGFTCSDCKYFKRTCEWLISCKPENVRCDWAPSRFSLSIDSPKVTRPA